MPHSATYWMSMLALSLSMILATGCRPAGNDESGPAAETEEAGHEHEHGHAHGHDEELGPNGGHLVELSGGEYAAEWLHDDDTDTVTVIVLDAAGGEEVPIAAEDIYIDVQIEGGDTVVYTLPALAQEGDEASGEHSRFQLSESALLVALKMEEGVTNTLRIDLDGESYTGHIEHHEHEGHGHSHSH